MINFNKQLEIILINKKENIKYYTIKILLFNTLLYHMKKLYRRYKQLI